MINLKTLQKTREARGQRGDTIVEVLIAIAVISLVLAGAYASSNKSAQATRTAQERTEALKCAETQVENLRLTGGAIPTSPTCPNNLYTPSIDPPVDGVYAVIVKWDGLGGGVNNVQLNYKIK